MNSFNIYNKRFCYLVENKILRKWRRIQRKLPQSGVKTTQIRRFDRSYSVSIGRGEVQPTASPSCEQQPVTSDPITGVFSLRDKCHVPCCRDLGHAYDNSEPSPVLWQLIVHLICFVKENDEAQSLTSKIRMLYFALKE